MQKLFFGICLVIAQGLIATSDPATDSAKHKAGIVNALNLQSAQEENLRELYRRANTQLANDAQKRGYRPFSSQWTDEDDVKDQPNATAKEEAGAAAIPIRFVVQAIPDDIAARMIGCSWKSECPVPLSKLRYITITHWGYDDAPHIGHMVVHEKLANELVTIFTELYEARFPIERMELIDEYEASDDRSMEANNSSAFCCRAITNKPGTFSLHSYGIAIDINPLVNPYVKGEQVLPAGGRSFLDRTQPFKGIITNSPDNAAYVAFTKRGYEWGGSWTDRIDYQHFQKQIKDLDE